MRTEIIETEADKRTGHRVGMLDSSAFFSRPTWVTTGTMTHLDSGICITDSALVLFSRPTWITTGAFMGTGRPDSRPETAHCSRKFDAFFSRPTWITTGSVNPGVSRHGSSASSANGRDDAERQDHRDEESLQFATAVLALKMALAGFRGDQRIYPRR
jgi:hypothetical protein